MIIKNEVRRIVNEMDPECPDLDAYLEGHASLFELVMRNRKKYAEDYHREATKQMIQRCMEYTY
jgi:hypothetical protein